MDSTAPPLMQITTSWPRDPRLHTRDHATFLRESLRETAIEHHRRHIPWHFEQFAAAKYGYKPRTRGYLSIKRKLGLSLPLVFTGRSRASATSQREVTATQNRVTLKLRLDIRGRDAAGNQVVISGSGRFRMKPGQMSLSRAQMQILARIEELRAVSADEHAYLAKFLAEKYTARANAPGTRYRTRNRASSA